MKGIARATTYLVKIDSNHVRSEIIRDKEIKRKKRKEILTLGAAEGPRGKFFFDGSISDRW